MDFAPLLEIVGDAPVFETGLLLVGDVRAYDRLRTWSTPAAAPEAGPSCGP